MRNIFIYTVIAFSTLCCNSNTEELANWNSFSNEQGGYSFKYPKRWKATIAEYNKLYSLFGSNIAKTDGSGIVSISKYKGSLESYLDYCNKYSSDVHKNLRKININGVNGIKSEFDGCPCSGTSVIIKNRNNDIISIIIVSKVEADLKTFDTLVSTFKLFN
jgi:hypothetical protein